MRSRFYVGREVVVRRRFGGHRVCRLIFEIFDLRIFHYAIS